jgi:hypothetical protein
MSRREIEALVAALRVPPNTQHAYWDGYKVAVRNVAGALQRVNPRFEVDRFLKDCEVQS